MSNIDAKFSQSEKFTRYIYGGLIILAGVLGMGALFEFILGLLLIAEAVFGFSVAQMVVDNLMSGKGGDNDSGNSGSNDNNNNQTPPNNPPPSQE